jgi:hypothetical protein
MKTLRLWVGIVCFAIGTVSVSSATTWYVAPSPAGNDSNSGADWTAPFATIQKGIDSASAGDTVLVSNGTYSVSASVMITNGVNNLTVQSLNGATATTIRASSSGYRVVYISGATNVTLSGLALSGGNLNNYGGGIFVDGTNGALGNTSANILFCIVTNNTAQGNSGGGIACGYGAVTLIRNCLVAGNHGGHVSGISGRGGTGRTVIESCTVTRNEADNPSQPAVYSEHTLFGTNCIAYDNSPVGNDIISGTWVYTLSNPQRTGTGNTNANPLFVSTGTGYGTSLSGGDFRLQSSSPVINAGTNLAWMATAKDLAGNPRLNGRVDMGAYELGQAPLSCLFSGSPTIGLGPLTSVFTATAGGDTNGIQYRWDFDANGTYDTPWSVSPVATNAYSSFGIYSVGLMVTNGAGEIAVRTNVNYIRSSPAVLYVAPSSGNTLPYSDWSLAAATLPAALDLAADGATIVVSNGVYGISNEISVVKAVTIRSLGGAANTTIRRSSGTCRVFNIAAGATNWTVEGLTISDGAPGNNNGAGLQILGAGVIGALRNCIILNNNSVGGGAVGGGIACGSGASTTIRNCIIVGNSCGFTHAAGISIRGGAGGTTTVENCTFVSNLVTGSGTYVGYGGETAAGQQSIVNSLFIGDVVTNEVAITPVTYTRIIGKAGTGNITDDPQVTTYKGFPYYPGPNSPCINAGTNLLWMSGATDLAGQKRAVGRPDMGAYEVQLPAGTVISVR